MGINFGHYDFYLDGKRLTRLVGRVIERVNEIDFDTIAVCGISGLLVGAPLAVETGKKLLIVRKPSEPTMSMEQMAKLGLGDAFVQNARNAFSVSGFGNNQKILLLDDHVASGTTLKLMVAAINKQCTNPNFAAVLLYHVPSWYRTFVGSPVSYTFTNSDTIKETVPILSLS